MLPQDHDQRVVLNEEKIKEWLSKGAQPTDRLVKLFANLGLVSKPSQKEQPVKSAPKAKALERIKEKEEKAAAAAEAAAEASAE